MWITINLNCMKYLADVNNDDFANDDNDDDFEGESGLTYHGKTSPQEKRKKIIHCMQSKMIKEKCLSWNLCSITKCHLSLIFFFKYYEAYQNIVDRLKISLQKKRFLLIVLPTYNCIVLFV